MNVTLSRGVSLIESLLSTLIAAVVTAGAGMALSPWVERLRVESVAAEIETNLQHARSAAVARGLPVRFELRRQAETVCYVVHDGATGDCPCERRQEEICRAGVSMLRVSWLPTDRGLRASATAASMVFEPVHGVATPTTSIDVAIRQQPRVRLVVNVMGRVRSCSLSAPVPGLSAC